MADGRQRDEWARASAILAITAEANRDPKKRARPFTSAFFNPFSEEDGPDKATGIPITADNIGALKALLK